MAGNCCHVIVRGQHFDSMKEAAAHFGLSPTAVSQALRRRGDLETLGLPSGTARRGRTKPRHPVRTVLFGVSFESRCEASRELNISRTVIRRVATGAGSDAETQRVYAALMRRAAAQMGA